ncbi:MAG: site-specific integrase [Gaiellales bacterium]
MQASSSGPRSRKLERTTVPGIYKRGGTYVVVFRDPTGRQCKRHARTLTEARAVKAEVTTDVRRGEYRTQSNIRFRDHYGRWIDTYQGRTGRGFRENTRRRYRDALEQRALPSFGPMKLAEIEPQHIKQWLLHLAEQGLAPASIRNLFAPLRAMLADAAEDGLIRSNPAAGVRIPNTAKHAEPKAKALTLEEVDRLRAQLTGTDLLLVDTLLMTGMRISELIGLNHGDVDYGACRIHVRRRAYKGIDAPKSRNGTRQIPITQELTQRLWNERKTRPHAHDDDPLFASTSGERCDTANLYNRMLKPALRKARIPHGGFHRLRHTCATHLIRNGATASQAQLWLGHHDPGFTARTYVHLDASDLPDPRLLSGLVGTEVVSAPAAELRALKTEASSPGTADVSALRARVAGGEGGR